MGQEVLDLSRKPNYPNAAFEEAQGIGFTSQRTRDRLIARLAERGLPANVLKAMRVLPRHLFINEALANRAYEDTALPIGYGQTISQPLIVAQMTAWVSAGLGELPLERGVMERVLDIGTGSGYQAGVLAFLADEVVSVERIEPLQQRAKQVLGSLEITNIDFVLADGHWGYKDKAPYDAIICAAAAKSLPLELVDQLKVGARMVLPIGETEQVLWGIEKTADGYTQTKLADVLFVPLVAGELA